MEPAGRHLITTPWLFLAPFLLIFAAFMLLPAVA